MPPDPASPMTALDELLRTLPAASPFAFDLNARRCLRLDLSDANPALRDIGSIDAGRFAAWVRAQIAEHRADYAAGGYGEDRSLYRASPVFSTASGGARTVHLGIDLWLEAGSPVHAVLDGTVHSTRDNAAFGDYGPTIVLEHRFAGHRFYSLYGHLARASLDRTRPGQRVAAGDLIAQLGDASVNGGWPPHLHFQLVRDMTGRDGDHPGVCAASEQRQWLQQCPDPNLLLRIAALDKPAQGIFAARSSPR